MEWLTSLLDLPRFDAAFLIVAVLIAGIVRGFAGFGLSALVMASCAVFIPPVELIPVCWALEASASLMLARGGWRDADRNVSYGLAAGSLVGLPLGLLVLLAVSEDASKLIALCLILSLALMQLAKIRFAFLATRAGLYGSGVAAGFAFGLASLGGMTVALYVLARDASATVMRASIILYLIFSAFISGGMLALFGLIDAQSLSRSAVLIGPAIIGTLIGQRFFIDRYAQYYRPFCLTLLIGLALAGIARLNV